MALKGLALTIAFVAMASNAAAQLPAAPVARTPPATIPASIQEQPRQDRQSAELGSADAMFSLGASYWAGRGIGEDLVEAYKWLDLAATYSTNREQETAVQARSALSRVLTPSQIEDAKKRAREWQAAFEKRK